MTERGLPPEGAPACPFVAFEDDRDGRASVPDHRHRCFAESRPAPRALAHQEAYCLSSAFPVCPTFQDWARREAAAARPAAAAGSDPLEEAPEIDPMPPLELEPERAAGTPPPIPPRRNPPRAWAAPPPWTGDPAVAGAAGAGAAGAVGAPGTDTGDPFDEGANPVAHEPEWTDVPVIAPPQDAAAPAWGGDSRGLAGSAAYRLAGPDPDAPDPPVATPGEPYEYPPVEARRNPQPAPLPRQAPSSRPPAGRTSPSRPSSRPPQATPQAAPPPGRHQDAAELFGPAWERPRRYEAYPTLRTRIGLPSLGGVPRIAMAALALVLAAMFLFFFGPMILGFGKNDQGTGSGPTATPTAEATDTPAPTEPPAPTPHVYTVKPGDTMSKIARKFNVTVEALLAANPKIKNPDRIKVGDKLTIPVAVEDAGDASAEP